MLVALSMPPVAAYYSRECLVPGKRPLGDNGHNAAIRLFSHAALPRSGSGCRVPGQTKTFTTLCLPGMMELLHLARWNIVKKLIF